MKSAIDLAPVNEGDVLVGRYRIERAIGRGGMAVVVAATHLQLEQLVAIKFLLPHVLMEPDVVARFTREARAAVRIRNEHVARVMDVGNLDSGAPFIVMEYLEGQDLSSVVSSQGALPVTDAVDYILQACEALAVAHGLGIVHRDLKPANLFVVESHGARSLKVLDFGISKNMALTSASGPDAGMTQSAFMLGSPSYMSPEQMNSAKNVDGLTDIWALGVTLYELLTGQAPFQAESLPLLCMAILQQQPASLRSRVPSLPEELDRVVLRCLEKDKTKRYQSIGELAAALEPFAPARSRLSLERISALAAKPPPVPNSLPAGGVASAAAVGSSASPRTAFDPRMPTVALDEPPEFPGLGDPDAAGAPAAAEPTASGNTAWQHTAAEGRPAPRRTPLLLAFGAGAVLIVGAVVAYSLSGSSTPDVQTPSSASTMASAPLAVPVTEPAPKASPPREPAVPVLDPASSAEPEPKAPAAASGTPPLPLTQSPELAKPKPVTAPVTRPPRQNRPRNPAPPPRSPANWEDER
ncbi:MAG TPA: protein kinase [Polyangiaceae bacterium]